MKRFLTKRNIIVAIVLVVIVGGWQMRAAAAKAKLVAAKTKVVKVVKKDVISSLLVSGGVVANKQVILNFQTPGKLGYVNVKEGDKVKAWQLLMGLNMGDLDAAVNTAYYKYLAADANAKYVEDLVKDHDKDESYAQKNTRVAAQTARDMAYDGWLSARRARDYANLVAPFEGIVTTITTNTVGDTVGLADGATVVDPTSLIFKAEVDESDVGKVKPEQKIIITLDAFPGVKFDGKIEEIGFVSGLSSSGATVFPVKIKITGENLRIGMNGDAEIILDTAKNVLAVPSEAIVNDEVTMAGNEAKKVKVSTGLVGDTDTEIKAGLNEGDSVVIK